MAVIAGTETLDAPLDHPREDGEDRTNLIINYLPQAMTDNELYSMFITVGQIVSAKIMRDKSSGYSYGYGFVHYQSPQDASKAIATLNGLQVSNKRIKVSYSRPNTADIKDTNLYVGNVPQGITEEDLQNLFGPYGNILTKKLLRDQGGKVKGIAFIRFSKKSEADAAMADLHGYQLPGASRGLDVKVAEDHGRQKAAFYAGWMVGQGGGEEGGSEWGDGGGYDDSGYENYGGFGQGFGRGGRGGGGGFGGRGGAGGFGGGGFGLQAFAAPGSGMRGGMGGNRFNPMSRGGGRGGANPGFAGNAGNLKGGAFGGGPGFARGGFGGARGMPARGGGGFMRGGSRGGAQFGGGYGGADGGFGGNTWSWVSPTSSAKRGGGGKIRGRGLLPVPSHMYTGEPLIQAPIVPIPQLSLFSFFPSEFTSDQFWLGGGQGGMGAQGINLSSYWPATHTPAIQ